MSWAWVADSSLVKVVVGITIDLIRLINSISMPLHELIIDRIRRQGPLSFRDFMEMALYYPGQGYYAAPRDTIGEKGDFYTSPYLTSLFGEMIAGQLEEMWTVLGRRPFTVVECGAGT